MENPETRKAGKPEPEPEPEPECGPLCKSTIRKFDRLPLLARI